MYKILKKETLNKDVDLMVVHAPLVSKNALPGHFIILRVNDEGERIPLTIVDIEGENVSIIYQKLGYSTSLLGQLNEGDSIADFVGPLGKPAHIRDVKSVLGIAGGVGAAPLLPQLKEYKRRGVNVDLVIGARNKDYIILLDKYKKYCDNIYVATDDGSLGTKGFVTDVLVELYKEKKYDHTIAIGPLVMMKFVVILNKKYNIPTDVSLNPIMIDGTGMCGNCRVTIDGKTFFACIDGPDFPGEGVNFDELIARQDYYHEEEHVCNLRLVKK
ncbi:MAG: sulfide/dihydroorotate dehydrogenase-like FAD/NAD-binding protein [Candidatus Izimaplasma sp.]|nr:sulfide/dihydroorotate dehydrogenase-like FAD/NAD-binding protein [Candidatus Izimaplasma bacterium]